MKKLICCILSISILFCVCCVSVSAQNSCNCGDVPYIYVAALGSATLYQNAGTPDERVVFRPENEAYVNLAKELAVPVARLLVTKDYDSFADSLIASASKIFSPLTMQKNGDSTPDITTKETLPIDPAHGLGRDYYFGYDFRADPLVTAEKLNEFINHVKQLTGHSKVSLRASSMGGVMTMAYLYRYGTDSIKDIVFQCCPLLGTAVAGELYTGKMEVNAQALYRYAYKAVPSIENDPAEVFLRLLLDTLRQGGVFDKLAGVADNLIDNIGDRIMSELLVPIFKANCGIWSFVPDAYYLDAKAYMLGENPNDALEERLDEYHYNVQCNARNILCDAVDDGVRIMILAGYNMQRTPLVTAYLNDSDGTVDTMYASAGATVAKLGETLGDGYTQAVPGEKNYLSADGRIDASTCILPEHTWFVKNMLHSNTHGGHKALYNRFYTYDGYMDVFSDPAYPQFLLNDIDNACFTPVTQAPEPELVRVTPIYAAEQLLLIARLLIKAL